MSNYEPELNDILLDGDLLDPAEEAEVDLAESEFAEEEPARRSTDLVRLYLQEIGRVPLLGRDEEVALAQRVQDYMKLLDVRLRLQKELGREPTLAEWAARANQYPEWANLTPEKLQQIQRIGKRAKEHMIKANLRLVVSVAKKYQNRGLELLDLIEALGQLQVAAALGQIRPYLEHPSIRLQCAAARACYRLTGDPTFVQPLLSVLSHPNIHLRRAALLDLGASGYLPAAQAMAAAAVEANIKLLALKQLVELNLRRGKEAGTDLHQVLRLIDELL